MAQKLTWLLLLSVALLSEKCNGNSDSSEDRPFGYELVQAELDCLMNSQLEISKELTRLRDATVESSKIIHDRQNALIENLLNGVFRTANSNKFSGELAQLKDELALMRKTIIESAKLTAEKQTNLTERLIDGILTIVNNNSLKSKQSKVPIESCEFAERSGLHKLSCKSCQTIITVLCEMDSFDGGWIVLQQRLDNSVKFNRNWQQYRQGFGNVGKSSEFWLGLELIHQITNSGEYELVIEVRNKEGKLGYARYSDFKIAGESEKYQLIQLGEYSGTIGDSFRLQNGCKFSTFDQDNDEWKELNCAQRYFSGGGWWYRSCAHSALNGGFVKNDKGFGIHWHDYTYEATYSRMMIRRKGTFSSN